MLKVSVLPNTIHRSQIRCNRLSECHTKSEIDDGLEYVLSEIPNLRLPAINTICTPCGLVQAGPHENVCTADLRFLRQCNKIKHEKKYYQIGLFSQVI